MTSPAEIRKVVIQGDSGTGKSSLITRLATDSFKENGLSTIGLDFQVKNVMTKDGGSLKLQIWDTAGRERFRTVTSSYYRGASGVILAVSLVDKNSLKNIVSYYNDLEKMGLVPMPVVFLVGTKADLKEKRVVSAKELQDLAESWNAIAIETSAKSGFNCSELLESITEHMSNRPATIERKIDDVPVKSESKSWWESLKSIFSWG